MAVPHLFIHKMIRKREFEFDLRVQIDKEASQRSTSAQSRSTAVDFLPRCTLPASGMRSALVGAVRFVGITLASISSPLGAMLDILRFLSALTKGILRWLSSTVFDETKLWYLFYLETDNPRISIDVMRCLVVTQKRLRRRITFGIDFTTCALFLSHSPRNFKVLWESDIFFFRFYANSINENVKGSDSDVVVSRFCEKDGNPWDPFPFLPTSLYCWLVLTTFLWSMIMRLHQFVKSNGTEEMRVNIKNNIHVIILSWHLWRFRHMWSHIRAMIKEILLADMKK